MGARGSKSKSLKYQNKEKSANEKSKEKLELSSLPARVDKINIAGLNRTHDDYVYRASDGIFKASNFQDLIIECSNTRQYLIDLGIFKELRVHVDISRGEKATPNGYQVTFEGTEFPRLLGNIGAEVGQNEGSMLFELASPNVCGRGEKIIFQGSYSTSRTTDFNVRLFKPFYHTFLKDYRPDFSIRLFHNENVAPVMAYRSKKNGIQFDLGFLTNWPFKVAHSLEYESSLREILAYSKHTPFFIRENFGPRMFSVFRHILTYDNRDYPIFPDNGVFLKTINEISAFGGNVSYRMSKFHAEAYVPLFSGLITQFCAEAGYIAETRGSKTIPIDSKFMLGGPLSIRGFETCGVGEHCNGFPTGAHSFWAAGLHLWTPLPFNSYFGQLGNSFRVHFFYNVGNSDSFSTENMRSAAGIGIAFKLAERARIELNYCNPLKWQKDDRLRRGFQFGIGYEFL